MYLEDDSLVTIAQIQTLQNMALLCPFTEGLAVYEARALVPFMTGQLMAASSVY